MIESDYLHPQGVTPEKGVHPVKSGNLSPGEQPFRYLGRQIALNDMSSWKEDNTAERYADLTVLGWGNPYFSALYSECFSVFGCYDNASIVLDEIKSYSYEVVGWYANQHDDYIQKYLRRKLNDSQVGASDFAKVAKDIADWQAPSGDQPERMVCYGRVNFAGAPSMDDGISTEDTKLALAQPAAKLFPPICPNK